MKDTTIREIQKEHDELFTGTSYGWKDGVAINDRQFLHAALTRVRDETIIEYEKKCMGHSYDSYKEGWDAALSEVISKAEGMSTPFSKNGEEYINRTRFIAELKK